MGLCGTINLLLWFKKKYCSAHKYNSCNIRQCSGWLSIVQVSSFFFSVKDHLDYMHLGQCHVNSFLPWLPLCIKLNPHSLTHCLCSSQSHSNSFSTLITDKHVDTRHSLVGEFSNYTLTAWANFNSDIKGNLLFL